MPTPLTTVDRYIHPEQADVYWLESVDDIHDVTRDEIESGTDLTSEIADAPGWDVSANRVPTPDLGNRFTARIAGRIDPGDSQIMFYGDRGTEDIRDLLGRGDQGYILIAHGGDIPGQLCDVYPVEVVAVSKPLDVGGDPAQITIDFATTGVPAEDVEIPDNGS